MSEAEARSITVMFRGVFLLNLRAPDGPEILLPNAESPPVCGGGTAWSHADNDDARKHFARIGIWRKNGSAQKADEYRNIHGSTLRLVGQAAVRIDPALQANVVDIADVVGADLEPIRLVGYNDREFWSRTATRIVIKTGDLSSDSGAGTGMWFFQNKFNPYHGAQIPRALAVTLTLRVAAEALKIPVIPSSPGASATEISLNAGDTAIVYNFDEEQPTRAKLEGSEPADVLVDYDFKWIYQLLRPVKGTLDEWRRSRWLPAPQLHVPVNASGYTSMTPVTSSCFFARWR